MSNHIVEKAVRYGGAAKKHEPTNEPLCTTCRLEVGGWIVGDCNIANYCLWQPAFPMELHNAYESRPTKVSVIRSSLADCMQTAVVLVLAGFSCANN